MEVKVTISQMIRGTVVLSLFEKKGPLPPLIWMLQLKLIFFTEFSFVEYKNDFAKYGKIGIFTFQISLHLETL